jgi:retron-type reverse transcriptase
MTTARAVGAVSSEAAEWYAINWQAIHRNVRRLQVRIAQATKAGRWGEVRALQRLLTHSYSGKVLAVRRVTENADNNSYGFRQQRSCADAIEQCFKTLYKPNPQWILEGDIKSCFDRISHDWLLAHVPMDRAILQECLKSGYMEKHVLHEITDGTPQGGIITPLAIAFQSCRVHRKAVLYRQARQPAQITFCVRGVISPALAN